MTATVDSPELILPDRAPGTPLLELDSDLTLDGRFGSQTLHITSTHVRVTAPDAAAPLVDIPVADIASARNESLVGGGRLEITLKNTDIRPVIAYTASLSDRFSEAARGIEQLAKGEPFSIGIKLQKIRCPKCGRLLPERDGHCPACVSKWKMIFRIGRFLTVYKFRTLALAALAITSAALHLAPPLIQRQIINKILIQHEDFSQMWTLIGLWTVLLAFGAAVQITQGRLIAFLSAHVIADIRAAVYRAIEFLKMSYFEKRKAGAIQSRLTNDTQNIWGFLVDGVPFLLSNTLQVLGILAIMLWTNWVLTLCILSPVLIVMVISSIFWSRLISRWHRWSHKWARFQSHLTEALSGIKVMKAFAQEDQENQRFIAANDGLRHSGTDADQYWSTVFGTMSFFIALGMLVHFAVGGWMVFHDRLTIGDFVMMQVYLGLIYGPMQWFAAINNWFSRAMAGAERIFEVMDTEPEKYLQGNNAHPIVGEVQFENVRFGYDKSNPVIKGMSFTAAPGEMIGLVGKSGSGKSTTINLICRFYEPDSGCIRIDGIDSRQLSLQDMRSQIGVVLQEPFLFNGTVAENISYGKPGAPFEDIIAAAKAANAHHFILGKPDGYDSQVGERGSKLSGGERQRVSIARAILHNPRILILDEATSSVDVETEKQIQEAIGRLVQGRTTFAIAHRLSTLRNANRLIVLEKGEIVECGTHAELMAKQGVFYNLVKTQTAVNEIVGVGNA